MAGTSFDRECFYIAPIGAEGSPERERSDGVKEFVVAPAADHHGLETIRADDLAQPGEITRQVIEHVLRARAAVVDLTGANPNVYYEMAIRHTADLPTVLIAEEGTRLPFDIAQMRTIFFDSGNLRSAATASDLISRHLEEALNGQTDSPVRSSIRVSELARGENAEQLLAELVGGIDELAREVREALRRDRHRPALVVEPPVSVENRDGSRATFVIEQEDDARTLRASGEINVFSAPELQRLLREQLDDQPRRLTLDLTDVTFMDSTALGAVLGAKKRARDQTELEVRLAEGDVSKLFDITGLDEMLHVVRTGAKRTL